MNGAVLRGVVVGASTLLGKELADELASFPGAAWDLILLDDGEAAGQMMAAGDEAMLIQPVKPEAFHNADIVFFAGEPSGALRFADAAKAAGANLVDLSGGLLGQKGMVLHSPWTSGGGKLDLSTAGIVSANAAALMLAVLAERLKTALGEVQLVATVLQPASQQGSAGLDELHQQTVGLLSFQSVPKDLYDAQVAFSLRSSLGARAKVDLAALRTTMRRQFDEIVEGDGRAMLALQLLQAPVFHGFTASVYVRTAIDFSLDALREALSVSPLRLPGDDEDSPSNESAAAQTDVLVQLAEDDEVEGAIRGLWVWMAADNLRLAAHHAAACALELAALRPSGNVQ